LRWLACRRYENSQHRLTLASLAVVLIILFFSYLIIGGHSGGNNPTSVNGLLFPIAFLFIGRNLRLAQLLAWFVG